MQDLTSGEEIRQIVKYAEDVMAPLAGSPTMKSVHAGHPKHTSDKVYYNKEINGYKFQREYDDFQMMLYEKCDEDSKISAVFVFRGKRKLCDGFAAAKLGISDICPLVGPAARVKRFREAISTYMSERAKVLNEVTLTGHSLGGHFAAIVTARLCDVHDPETPVGQLAHNMKCYAFNAASHYTKADKVLIRKVPNIYFLIIQDDVISQGFFGNLNNSLNFSDNSTQCVLFTRLLNKPKEKPSGFFSKVWKCIKRPFGWFKRKTEEHRMTNLYDPKKQKYDVGEVAKISSEQKWRWNKKRKRYERYTNTTTWLQRMFCCSGK